MPERATPTEEVRKVGEFSFPQRITIVHNTAENTICPSRCALPIQLLRFTNPELASVLQDLEGISHTVDKNILRWFELSNPLPPDDLHPNPDRFKNSSDVEELRDETLTRLQQLRIAAENFSAQHPDVDLAKLNNLINKKSAIVPMMAEFLIGADPHQTVVISYVYSEFPVLADALALKFRGR